jgi:hypothetical protein
VTTTSCLFCCHFALGFNLLFQLLYARTRSIYQIKAECKGKPNLRLQTGVRIQGYSGVVTALHGVAGCAEITAISNSPVTPRELVNISDLEIVQVDIARDIALLAPKAIEKRNLWKAGSFGIQGVDIE